MKGYKQIFVLAAVAVFIAPQIAFAAWWNPFSWNISTLFNRKPKQQITAPTPSQPNTSTGNTNVNNKSTKTTTQGGGYAATLGDSAAPAPSRIPSTGRPTVPVSQLKKQDPQQYKTLVSENKTQLLEASKTLSNKNIIAKVKPAVVYIETDTVAGSGVIIDTNGYILTNAHVVAGVNSATIKLSDGRSFVGNVVGRDENIDLALLKIATNGLSTATLGDSDFVEQGDPVFALGYPLGIEGDVDFKDGTLSRRQNIDGVSYLEISAQILPGNSGGPLVNQAGDVIGINTLAIAASKLNGTLVGETLKFAIPINVAQGLIPKLKAGRNVIVPKITSPNPSPLPSPSQVPIPQQPPASVFVPSTPPPTPPPPTPFEFDVQVTVEPSGYASGGGRVRISISKPFYGCILTITKSRSGLDLTQAQLDLIHAQDDVVFARNSDVIESRDLDNGAYKYEISCNSKQSEMTTKTGSFTITSPPPPPPPPLPKIKAQTLQGEFKFQTTHYSYSSSGSLITSDDPLEGSALIKLKIRATLTGNATSTNQLIFSDGSKNSTGQVFFNVKDGDILEINPASQPLTWSFSGNPDDLSLKIIEGSATVTDGSHPYGQNISLEF